MRISGKITLGCAMALLAGTAAWAARPDLNFSRYELILERQPFGVPEAAPVATAEVSLTPPPDAFIKSLRMCAITESEFGLRVGLIDLKSAPPKSYFLYIGGSEDGVELVEADFATERAKLRKGSEEYWISMGGDAQGGGGGGDSGGNGGGAASASVTAAGGGPGPITTVVSADQAAGRRLTYAERLRRRREADEQRMKELATRPVVSPEALDAQLKQYQMDVIRKGEPPLPIPLTPEMDDQLVAEGVLPPLEQ